MTKLDNLLRAARSSLVVKHSAFFVPCETFETQVVVDHISDPVFGADAPVLQVRLLSLPDLQGVSSQPLGGDTQVGMHVSTWALAGQAYIVADHILVSYFFM